MPPFHHLIDTSEDIVETVNSEILLHSNLHFPLSLHDDGSNLHSDDSNGTSKKRAFERVLTYHQAPIIGRKRAISVMAINIDDHHKKRKISSECVPKWTPEEATLPLCIDSNDYKISSTKCDTSRIYQDLDIARIPTPYCFDRHPYSFTFASEMFEHNRPHQLH
jgi:hypothetical protein